MRPGLPTTDARFRVPARSPPAACEPANNATAPAHVDREMHTKKGRSIPAPPGFPGRATESEPDGCKETGRSAPRNIALLEPQSHPHGPHSTSGWAAEEAPVSPQADPDCVAPVPSPASRGAE